MSPVEILPGGSGPGQRVPGVCENGSSVKAKEVVCTRGKRSEQTQHALVRRGRHTPDRRIWHTFSQLLRGGSVTVSKKKESPIQNLLAHHTHTARNLLLLLLLGRRRGRGRGGALLGRGARGAGILRQVRVERVERRVVPTSHCEEDNR